MRRAPSTITVSTTLRLFGEHHALAFVVPGKPCTWRDLLPQLQQLTDVLVSAGTAKSERDGKHITCAKGCGACCSQLVPISEVETYEIRRLVQRLPALRREQIRSRFRAAERRFGEAGIWPRLIDADSIAEDDYEAFGLEYFRVGVSCPFLEEGSCSIHRERPLVCREYLVTNSPAACTALGTQRIDGVAMPGSVSAALYRQGRHHTARGWVPLVAALAWSDVHAPAALVQPGQDMLRSIIEAMTRKKIGLGIAASAS